MPPSGPYPARRRRKVRLTTGIGMGLLAIPVLVFACLWFAVHVFHPWLRPRLEARELARLAALPYPDPHPDQAALLTFTEHMDGINICTGWLPIHTVHGTDGQPSGSMVMHLTTRLDPAPRAEPDREVSITFATPGAARLPAAGIRTATRTPL